MNPGLRLVSFVMLNDFSDDEIQELLGKLRIQIRLVCQVFKTCDLGRFAIRIRRGKVVCGFQFPNSLRVFEPLAKRINEDCVKPVDAVAVLFKQFSGACRGVSQWPSLSV